MSMNLISKWIIKQKTFSSQNNHILQKNRYMKILNFVESIVEFSPDQGKQVNVLKK